MIIKQQILLELDSTAALLPPTCKDMVEYYAKLVFELIGKYTIHISQIICKGS